MAEFQENTSKAWFDGGVGRGGILDAGGGQLQRKRGSTRQALVRT